MILDTIPALTLWQPWASAIAFGLKRYETRSWPPPASLKPGDLLAIHAAKRDDTKGFDMLSHGEDRIVSEAFAAAGVDLGTPLPMGKVVCVCRLLGTDRTGVQEVWPTELERALGDWSVGRWAWELELVYRLREPIPARGRQGIWQWEWPDCVRYEAAPETMTEGEVISETTCQCKDLPWRWDEEDPPEYVQGPFPGGSYRIKRPGLDDLPFHCEKCGARLEVVETVDEHGLHLTPKVTPFASATDLQEARTVALLLLVDLQDTGSLRVDPMAYLRHMIADARNIKPEEAALLPEWPEPPQPKHEG